MPSGFCAPDNGSRMAVEGDSVRRQTENRGVASSTLTLGTSGEEHPPGLGVCCCLEGAFPANIKPTDAAAKVTQGFHRLDFRPRADDPLHTRRARESARPGLGV